jgi:tRNA (guanine37-N1)-methyltransferase
VGISIVTALPDLVRSYLEAGVLGRGIDAGLLDVSVVDVRDFADRDGGYRQIDDYSYGGGGMVLMPRPLAEAVDSVADRPNRFVVYPSPQGVALHQELVEDIRGIAASRRLVIVCGRYEGVDERFVRSRVDLEVSLGDFVVAGGELAALTIVDSVSRLVRGVVGRERAVEEDSFFCGMLDHPHYTRPEEFEGALVPGVLLGGDSRAIETFRRNEAAARTLRRRPDLLARAGIMAYLEYGVYVLQLHSPVLDRNGQASTTSITGMDLHDIARACRTYGVKKYLVVTPLAPQREMVKKIAAHWTTGYGADFNPDRAEAMRAVKAVGSLDRALEWIKGREKRSPLTVATTARKRDDSENWLSLKRKLLEAGRPIAFVFGTGHGLHEDVIKSADAVMSPITGGEGYDHLSVRSAASIVLDRFFGLR